MKLRGLPSSFIESRFQAYACPLVQRIKEHLPCAGPRAGAGAPQEGPGCAEREQGVQVAWGFGFQGASPVAL